MGIVVVFDEVNGDKIHTTAAVLENRVCVYPSHVLSWERVFRWLKETDVLKECYCLRTYV